MLKNEEHFGIESDLFLGETLPNIFQRINSLLKALIHWKEAPQELRLERLLRCFSCENLDLKNDVCRVCGCFVHYKTRSTNEKCPLGYW